MYIKLMEFKDIVKKNQRIKDSLTQAQNIRNPIIRMNLFIMDFQNNQQQIEDLIHIKQGLGLEQFLDITYPFV